MRKFKHITGEIATRMTEKINHIHKYASIEFGYIHPKLIEDSAEWEEIIEKDYEILSFRLIKGIFMSDNERIIHSPFPGYTEKDYTGKSKVWDIHSIKRLNDGETFAVGDKISLKSHINEVYGVITELYVSYDQLRFYCGNLGGVLCHDIDKRNDFVKHKPKELLFTNDQREEIINIIKLYNQGK